MYSNAAVTASRDSDRERNQFAGFGIQMVGLRAGIAQRNVLAPGNRCGINAVTRSADQKLRACGCKFQEPATAFAGAVLQQPDGAVRPLLYFADTTLHVKALYLARLLTVKLDAHQRL